MGEFTLSLTWEQKMEDAIKEMLNHESYRQVIEPEHTKKTPERVVKAFKEYFRGCEVDIGTLLTSALFSSNSYSQMVHVRDITFFSVCAHHLALISGTVHFAYVPAAYIIGLSKIPRLVDAYARRPQVQENMTAQIADAFMRYVLPAGCGVSVRADHACMQCRGVRAENAVTETMALRGSFLENTLTRQEFISSILRGQR